MGFFSSLLELFQSFCRPCRAANFGCSLLSAGSSLVNKSRLEKRLQPKLAVLPDIISGIAERRLKS
jgi:hypothetical protein